MTARPPPEPQRVRYNDWRQVEVPAPDAFEPELPVSVIVPYYAQPAELARALAALECQTYPRKLVEVVVVDDGSPEPLVPPRSTSLDVKVVRQEDRGFRLAAARNAGVRSASHDVLVFMDADMIPEPEWVAAHARWHHVVPDALTVGVHAHVSVDGVEPDMIRHRSGTLEDLFRGRVVDLKVSRWIAGVLTRTDELTTDADDHFRLMTGGNFGVRREFFDRVGGFAETFSRWGGEDTEFGYRAFVRGGLIVPVREALTWHQGSWEDGNAKRARNLALQVGTLADLIPHRNFRPVIPGRSYVVPQFVVTIRRGTLCAERFLAAAACVLSGSIHDLVVRLEQPPDDAGREWLEQQLGSDPRVRVAPSRPALEEFPTSPFHVSLPAWVALREDVVQRLQDGLGNAVMMRSVLPDGSHLSITRAWALHRASRTRWEVSDYGEVVALPRPETVLAPQAFLGTGRARLRVEWSKVDGPGAACRFAWWLGGAGCRRVIRRFRASARQVEEPRSGALSTGSPGARYPLGIEVAVRGPRSHALLRASARVAQDSTGRDVGLVVADTPAEAADAPAPVVVLSEAPSLLSTPAFDPLRHNPIGWLRHHDGTVGALGPLDQLPRGCKADRVVRRDDGEALREIHHLEDVAAYHADAAARAGELVRLAAMGVTVRLAEPDERLIPYLGDDIFELLTRDVRGLDAAPREAHSIRLRRAALREHSLRMRARQLCVQAGIVPPPLPLVSVLLVTRRPSMLQHALATVARQTYPRLELVLGLHGQGFVEVDRQLKEFPVPATVVRIDPAQPLGAALNRAAAEAKGAFFAKMDDDDAYGCEHVWDLVLAQEYAQAECVTKAAEYFYLAELDATIHRWRGQSEKSGQMGGGSSILVKRETFSRVGGFPRRSTGEDRHLMASIMNRRAQIYRTHGAGYVPVRNGPDHSWGVSTAQLLGQADSLCTGCDPERLCIEDMAASYLPPIVVAAGLVRPSVRSLLDRLD